MTAKLAYQIIQQCSEPERKKLMNMLEMQKSKPPKQLSVEYWEKVLVQQGQFKPKQ